MGQRAPDILLRDDVDVDVTVVLSVAVADVGRAGAAKLPVLLVSGQMSGPHARSVGQQPPPRETGQDRKPEEHISVATVVEVLDSVLDSVLVSVLVSVGDGEDIMEGLAFELDNVGRGATAVAPVVLDSEEGDGLEKLELGEGVSVGVGVGVGVTTTTAVEVAMQPSS